MALMKSHHEVSYYIHLSRTSWSKLDLPLETIPGHVDTHPNKIASVLKTGIGELKGDCFFDGVCPCQYERITFEYAPMRSSWGCCSRVSEYRVTSCMVQDQAANLGMVRCCLCARWYHLICVMLSPDNLSVWHALTAETLHMRSSQQRMPWKT